MTTTVCNKLCNTDNITHFSIGFSWYSTIYIAATWLHWLPITSRIMFKLCLVAFKCYIGVTPHYLSSMCKQHRMLGDDFPNIFVWTRWCLFHERELSMARDNFPLLQRPGLFCHKNFIPLCLWTLLKLNLKHFLYHHVLSNYALLLSYRYDAIVTVTRLTVPYKLSNINQMCRQRYRLRLIQFKEWPFINKLILCIC